MLGQYLYLEYVLYASLLWDSIGKKKKKKYDQFVRLSDSGEMYKRVWHCRKDL